MGVSQDLLLEIGTEELPPKALPALSEALLQGVRKGLDEALLGYREAAGFCTPRRLAVLISGLEVAQPDKTIERRGPALQRAFDSDGTPTRACLGFARSCGVEVDALERMRTDKGSWLIFRREAPGRRAEELLPAITQAAVGALPVPKRMRWASLDVEFVRPVHWVVMLLGTEVVPCRILGLEAGRSTLGHRFHHPEAVVLERASDYVDRMRSEAHVLVSFAERRTRIRSQIEQAASALNGRALIEDALLEEVTALVEWPVAISGSFDTRFLEMPPEALICTMQGHQKYFPVVDAKEQLLANFITVSNIESKQPQAVREGNERVIRPRLADAAFFWEQDGKQTLAGRIEALQRVVFQEHLGSLREKAERVAASSRDLASVVGADTMIAARAAMLAKCDLLTQMVGEFPELQGVMGRYFAQRDGEPQELAQALEEQYLPRFAGDRLPATPVGQTLGIADRLDTLVGIFGIGQRPSGDRDPFALRRAALGVLRIVVERELDVDLVHAIATTASTLGERVCERDTQDAVLEFMLERLRSYYMEQGFRPDVFEAVLATRPTRPRDFDCRIRAVRDFLTLPEARNLAAANKRIRNILRKSNDQTGKCEVDGALLSETAEVHLYEELERIREQVTPLVNDGNYGGALERLAGLQETVDRFFDEVMVMAEDEALKRNRLALLAGLADLFFEVADVSRLQS